jgi:hypothetical protein
MGAEHRSAAHAGPDEGEWFLLVGGTIRLISGHDIGAGHRRGVLEETR